MMVHFGADVTMALQATNHGKDVICVLSDDSCFFVHWVYEGSLQCKVQMEWWDGTVLIDTDIYT